MHGGTQPRLVVHVFEKTCVFSCVVFFPMGDHMKISFKSSRQGEAQITCLYGPWRTHSHFLLVQQSA